MTIESITIYECVSADEMHTLFDGQAVYRREF